MAQIIFSHLFHLKIIGFNYFILGHIQYNSLNKLYEKKIKIFFKHFTESTCTQINTPIIKKKKLIFNSWGNGLG